MTPSSFGALEDIAERAAAPLQGGATERDTQAYGQRVVAAVPSHTAAPSPTSTTATASCLYVGRVRHRRRAPLEHHFSYNAFFFYLDLDELPDLLQESTLWGRGHSAPFAFHREDFIGDAQASLRDAVSRRVEEAGRPTPTGPIRLLSQVRTFGYAFNPVTFYYCFDHSGSYVESVVAEITNTPWGERHSYVLSQEDNAGHRDRMRFHFSKAFHVSPFMPMGLDYSWHFSRPDERLWVHMENHDGTQKRFFDATLTLRRRPLTASSLRSMLFRFPFITAKVVAGIYWQALRLWLKRCPFYDHPHEADGPSAAQASAQKTSPQQTFTSST